MGTRKSRSQIWSHSSQNSLSDSDHTATNDIRPQNRGSSRRLSDRKDMQRRKITDEDIADYMAKKAQRKAQKVARKKFGSIPFEDFNLSEIFVWRKKIERDIIQGVSPNAYSFKAEKKRQRERMGEIKKVKKRREERTIENSQHEEEMALLARERARAKFQGWEEKELEFHFEQSKVRSEIRLREGRTEPIDVLTKNLDPQIPSRKVALQDKILETDKSAGSYSPEFFHGDENEEAIDLEEDMAILEGKRTSVLEDRRLQEMATKLISSDDNFENKASKAMEALEEGDAVFGTHDEINLDSHVYSWHDKYRPRKPKYFNRVHTGYEWNKYNQTHYDHDNPPPKIAQGYKFNIFYPDLVDKSKTPTYKIENDGDSIDTYIIRFHAGPPYEDLAFRVVNNREWEYSRKKGFKCTFERGILHLYFSFKRVWYRR